MNTLGERIKSLREKLNISQEQLSNATNISRSNISRIESNKINPTSDSIVAFMHYFNISSDWLLTGIESNIVTIEVEKRVEQLTGDTGRMTDPEVDIIHKFRKLDERDQDDTIAYVNMKYNRTMDFQKGISSKYQNGEETTATLEKKHA